VVNVNSNVDSYVTGQGYSHFTCTLEIGLKMKVLKNVWNIAQTFSQCVESPLLYWGCIKIVLKYTFCEVYKNELGFM
jgi:hypothetical protein